MMWEEHLGTKNILVQRTLRIKVLGRSNCNQARRTFWHEEHLESKYQEDLSVMM